MKILEIITVDFYVGPNFRHDVCENGVCRDTSGGGTEDLTDCSVTIADGKMTVTFTRNRTSEDERDRDLANAGESQAILVATGTLSAGDLLLYHGSNKEILQIEMPGADSSPSPTPESSGVVFFWSYLLFIACLMGRYLIN